jgi:hypothetical protein
MILVPSDRDRKFRELLTDNNPSTRAIQAVEIAATLGIGLLEELVGEEVLMV